MGERETAPKQHEKGVGHTHPHQGERETQEGAKSGSEKGAPAGGPAPPSARPDRPTEREGAGPAGESGAGA